jgi:hypothetical protein
MLTLSAIVFNDLRTLISGPQDSVLYFQKIQFLLMYMFQYEQPFTKTDLTNLTVEAADNVIKNHPLLKIKQTNIKKEENCFWTRHQREILEKDLKKVLLTSNFGTGKTLLLKTKVEQLARQKRDLTNRLKAKSRSEPTNKLDSTENDPGKTFLIFFAKKSSLVFQSIRDEFKNLKKIQNVEVEVLCLESKYFKNVSNCEKVR